MKKSLVMLALVALTVAALAIEAGTATAAPPVQVDWVKHVVDPANFVFEGTTSGDAPGTLTSKLVSLDAAAGPILHVTFDWIVSSGSKSFTARTSGIWNTNTGSVVMNGRVIVGYLNGAQVHEEGQLIDPATLSFQGFLQLLPNTAD
jgi:hypothetical protein